MTTKAPTAHAKTKGRSTMTWAELRESLNTAMPDDADLLVVHLEVGWKTAQDEDACDAVHLHWTVDDKKLVPTS